MHSRRTGALPQQRERADITRKHEIGVGMIGCGFMGKAHSLGYRDVDVIASAEVPRPRLLGLYGRDAGRLEEARSRYGWQRGVADWRELIADPDIQLIDNVGPNRLHVEPTLAAAAAGKHVYIEKPLAPTADEAYQMWVAVERAGVKHMCAFNYRFFPALQLARRMISSGELGEIHHFRSNFLLSSSLDQNRGIGWRDEKASAGSGALGDLGAHHIDISRFLMNADPVKAQGLARIAVPRTSDGHNIENDDFFVAILEYNNGAVGVLEASRVAGGHLVTSRIEVDGSKGSIQFSMQRLNELRVSGSDHTFQSIAALRSGDPYQTNWFPAGHPLGWVDSFSHEAMHVLGAIGGLHDVAPLGSTFRDGYFCAEVVEAILRSSVEGAAMPVTYRGPQEALR
jgi:predicted dehydrogenase